MSAPKTGPRTDRTEWLSLGEASRTLGVNTSTLRRWADADLVRTFRTPGGHRRFSASDLDRLMGAGVDPAQELDDEAIASIRERLNRDETQRDWLDRLDPGARRDLGELGRQMVQLLEAYVAPGASDLAGLDQQAGDIGRRYATLLQWAQVSLTEAVTAFAYFRGGMDEALRAYARKQGIDGEAKDSLWEKSATLEDRVLVALTAGYEEDADAARVPPGEER